MLKMKWQSTKHFSLGHQSTDMCVKHGGVRFHRIRDFKRYHFDSIPPANLSGQGPAELRLLLLDDAPDVLRVVIAIVVVIVISSSGSSSSSSIVISL